ncbi:MULTISPECIES: CDP-glycerol glycerophosphotransferase family protein [unclassified Arenibacter]|uniref:CDP-glycerol glycerophosphotransferase family protein n=1 Tax=unclassified Arenibacter TaxID=2615047 RepID=UPI000E34A072|nr:MULTISPECIES: CDP-glycerol glycerophosphotransferase family protein [unclassified Arenibacter]MCM4165608.1 CDP-glycerol--glycerophosphate glycerophosphotransferase [Arenibacter sp. A80]RFT54758.1 glycosyltransferase [Arenibacter sp. P308M17]
MKVILFCQNAYAFGILVPIRDVLIEQGHGFLWYISGKLLDNFPYKDDNYTLSTLDLQRYESDAIFVPGNEVPYYIRGLKVQVFHGLAGEKKGHFRIRHYFDLYLTQGPYFTDKFNELKKVHKNFDVIETGWPKLDVYSTEKNRYDFEKKAILQQFNTDKIVLFAPTFSPSLTSAPYLLKEIRNLAETTGYVVLIKFHDLMDQKWIKIYKRLSNEIRNVIFKEDKNIIKLLLQADILVSDTSSVIYEFILLNKPVITFKNISDRVLWDNSNSYTGLTEKVLDNFHSDAYAAERAYINMQFHPYQDGKSALRMVNAVKDYIEIHGVPQERKLSLARRLKINSIFGKPTKNPFVGEKTNKISAVLITYNEDIHINAVLENIKFADEIIVVDSFSKDGTIEKIEQHPHVKLIQRTFVNYTDQKSYALKQATHDWVLFLDADERVPDRLRNEILETINSSKPTADAYYFYRTFMFKDKVLHFSGWQSDKNYRLFRKSKVHFTEDRIVHETLVVDGPSGVLKNKLIHYSYKNYEDYRGKMIKYGQMKAVEEFKKDYDPNYYHFIIRPFYKFFNHYILRLGILDGKKGLIICYLNALGVYSRYKELKRLRNLK